MIGTDCLNRQTSRRFVSYKSTKSEMDRDRLVTDHLPMVHRLCRRFEFSGQPFDDLVQVGTLGLLKAVDLYVHDRGASFKVFAIPIIVREIKSHFRDRRRLVAVSDKIQGQAQMVEMAIEHFSQGLGRSPSIPEIAEYTGLSEEEVYDTFETVSHIDPLYSKLGSRTNGHVVASNS